MTDSIDDVVRYEVAEGVATVAMSRPRYSNAQNNAMTYALDAAFKRAVDDDEVSGGPTTHPQLVERARWVKVQSEVGELEAVKPPLIFDGFEPRMDPIPGLGAQTEEVLRSLGCQTRQHRRATPRRRDRMRHSGRGAHRRFRGRDRAALLR